MKDVEIMEQNKKKTIILTIAAILFLMILVMGATYAYFQIITNNNTNTSNISGVVELVGQATLTTNVSKL